MLRRGNHEDATDQAQCGDCLVKVSMIRNAGSNYLNPTVMFWKRRPRIHVMGSVGIMQDITSPVTRHQAADLMSKAGPFETETAICDCLALEVHKQPEASGKQDCGPAGSLRLGYL